MSNPEQKLAGKIALVTGGSRGIGAAIAQRLSAEGATVAISYNSSPDRANEVVKKIEKAGGKASAHKADSADSKQVAALVAEVAKQYGRIDILVNNAGVFESGDAGVEAVARQYAINVTGVVATTRAAIPHIKSGGRIINIGSVLGERVAWAGLSDYSATKFAVAGYTRGWARDLGPKGINVNVVQPGPIDTEMNPDDNGDFAKSLKAGIPLGRYGKAEEIAAAVAFLAGPDASYINGATLNVDGGANA